MSKLSDGCSVGKSTLLTLAMIGAVALTSLGSLSSDSNQNIVEPVAGNGTPW